MRMNAMAKDPYDHARRLAADSVLANDPTGWFELLYAEAEAGKAIVPWGGSPSRMLVEWAARRGLDGHGRRALVVGCGLGDDAEFVASLGFATVAFDVATSAVRAARCRFPGSRVEYITADLLNPPAPWHRAFDLVVEIFTIQVLPLSVRADAIANVADMVAPDGTLIVIARAGDDRATDEELGTIPWPLTGAEINAFAVGGCQPVRIESLPDTGQSSVRRWRAEFLRSA